MFLFVLCQRDDARERALNDMMGGVLEVKTEDILEKVEQNTHTEPIISYKVEDV